MSPWLIYLVFPVGIFAAMIIANSVAKAGDWMLALFGLAWCAVWGWNLYYWGFQTTYKLQLRGGDLQWFKPFARGTVPVADITAVATSSTFGRRAYIMLKSGKKLVVRNFKGFERFLADLLEENPEIAVDPADLEPWFPRLPGGGGRYLNQEVNNRWK
jgi:hypothetical protein